MRIDAHLGLNKQAVIVLEILAMRDFAIRNYIQTAAWYNGRECGFSLILQGPEGSRIITCAECRNSDEIVIDNWAFNGPYLNPPGHESMPTLVDCQDWRSAVNRKHIPYGSYQEAADYIEELIERYAHKEVRT